MPTTVELTLSPGYRHAQRAIALWIEQTGASARRQAFAARATLSALETVELGRLARWLAWLCIANVSRGDDSLLGRIRRLDGSLYADVDEALDLLPATAALEGQRLRLSA
jgi:hypothetical protein